MNMLFIKLVFTTGCHWQIPHRLVLPAAVRPWSQWVWLQITAVQPTRDAGGCVPGGEREETGGGSKGCLWERGQGAWLTLSTLSGLFQLLFWIDLNRSTGVKGLMFTDFSIIDFLNGTLKSSSGIRIRLNGYFKGETC